MAAKILVGTASWSDPGFVEFWYPKKMRPTDRLGWYAQHFNMVEVNSTFYSVPDPMLVRRWCDATPPNFVFNVKLHQLLSHHSTSARLLPPALQKKLRLEKNAKAALTKETSEEMLKAFTPSLEVLRRTQKLGVLLLQLSPAFSPRKHSRRIGADARGSRSPNVGRTSALPRPRSIPPDRGRQRDDGRSSSRSQTLRSDC